MTLCFALKLLKRRVLGDVEIREDEESAVSEKDQGGNAGGARAHRFSQNGCRGLWLQFDGVNLFGVPSTNKGGLSSRCPQVAHPVHDPVSGNKVAFLILDKNRDGGLDRLSTFPPANREQ